MPRTLEATIARIPQPIRLLLADQLDAWLLELAVSTTSEDYYEGAVTVGGRLVAALDPYRQWVVPQEEQE